MDIIKKQFNEMLDRAIIPCFEYELINKDHLVVDLQAGEKGIIFEFDDQSLPVSFDGEIENCGDTWLLPYDPYFEDLDSYLQMIDQNINEGFLIPNNLI